jgi:hypothetical protein
MYSYALGSFGIHMLVDSFLFVKILYDPLLWVECLSCLNWFLLAICCLIYAWNHVLFIWDQRSICHPECLAYMHLMEKPKLLFAAKSLHVPCLICKSWKWYVRCLCLKNVLPCHKYFKFLILDAKPLHDVHQWEVSYLEVNTWLSGFDMTWDSL